MFCTLISINIFSQLEPFLFHCRKELLEQKTQFTLQLEDAHKNVNQLQTKINEMQMKIETLEQELSTKTWNVESKCQGVVHTKGSPKKGVSKPICLHTHAR